MIDRTIKHKTSEESKAPVAPKAVEADAAERAAFTLYGKGGRAWAERHWNATSLSFNFASDQTRRI